MEEAETNHAHKDCRSDQTLFRHTSELAVNMLRSDCSAILPKFDVGYFRGTATTLLAIEPILKLCIAINLVSTTAQSQ